MAVGKITPIERARAEIRHPANLMQRRTQRILCRVLPAAEPIVWLRGCAGSGKSWLLEVMRVRRHDPAGDRARFLDDPDASTLARVLEALASGEVSRVLVGTRNASPAQDLLLREQVYGRVALFEEPDLFVMAQDAVGDDEQALLLETGGWPVLLSAAMDGRGDQVRSLLPEFLQREVLPELPEAVQAALFAAVTAALSSADLSGICEVTGPVHPLLVREGERWRPGTWLRDALVTLRPTAAVVPAVRARLRRFHARMQAPAPAIRELAAMGEISEALQIFKQAGGVFFGYRHGYRELDAVLTLFGAELERGVEELFLARLWLLIKSGNPREALMRLEARHPGLPVDLRRLLLTDRVEAILARIDISLDIDETPPIEVIASWGRLQFLLPADNHVARGILFNSMAIGFLKADALVEAKRMAEESLAAYRAEGSPYLVHCMYLHLCDIELRQSRLQEAAQLLDLADAALEASGQAFNSEPQILQAVRSRIAFEEGRFEDAPADFESILQALMNGDSWPDLIERLSVGAVLSGYWQHGLRHALERLDQCALTLSRRHGSVAHRRLSLLRILLLQVARHHAEADMLIEEYDLEPAQPSSAALAVEEGLVRLRQAVAQEHSRAAIGRLSEQLSRLPQVEARQRISIAILKAAAWRRVGDGAAARRHLRVALRESHSRGLVAVLLEDGEFVERLLPEFISAPGPGNTRLVHFATRVLRLLQSLPTAPRNSRAMAGVSRQEHRVLAYVADGYTSKQIGRALGLSESTVKFHLRSLFRKLKVRSRGELADAARSRGIAT